MAGPAPARLLDLTRLVSRVGRGPHTGVDRVELAYLEALLARPAPCFGLVRAAPGHVLLDRHGMQALHARLTGVAAWGRADLLARLHLRQSGPRRQAMSDLRRLARAQATGRGLARMLARHLPAGTALLNTGHSNLVPAVFAAMREVPGARIAVLIHDTIPLDHPEFTRAGVPAQFADRLQLVGSAADLVIYNSGHSQRAAERHFAGWSRVPPGLVAHLGVPVPRPDPAALAAALPPAVVRALPPGRPVFVVLGTIEPRKNHALLLDLWDDMAADLPDDRMPALCILGARGWLNAAVFDRLDTSPLVGRHVFELPGLGDGAVAALLARAHALLFPSLAEGYGLPALEAAALGVPVLCNNLEVFSESLGDYPFVIPVTDRYQWRHRIEAMAREASAPRQPAVPVPDWQSHFERVLSAI